MLLSTGVAPRPRLRALRVAGVLAAMVLLVAVPTADAASATSIDITLRKGYSITGTISDSAGAPLWGVTVSITGTTTGRSTATNATGSFEIVGLKPAKYRMHVSADTWNVVDGFYTTANAEHFTQIAGDATDIVVGPNRSGIDMRMPVGYSIAGHVSDTSGAPLAGAVISVPGTSRGARTNASGYYRLSGLRGSYRIAVWGKPASATLLDGWYASSHANHFVVSESSATSVSVGPSGRNLDIRIPRGYSISGRVFADGVPINSTVTTVPAAGERTTPVPNSNFTVAGLPAGTYKLNVTFGDQHMPGYYTNREADHFTSDPTLATGITVGPSRTSVTMAAATGYSIAGRITDPTGQRIFSALAVVDEPGSYRESHTDTQGRFLIVGLPPGRHRIRIIPGSKTGVQLPFQEGWYSSTTATHFTAVEANASQVTVGPSRTGIDVQVPAEYTVSGTINVPGDISNLSTTIVATSATDAESAWTNTGFGGVYTIHRLSKGSYVIRVETGDSAFLRGYYTTSNPSHFTTNLSEATKVTVGP